MATPQEQHGARRRARVIGSTRELHEQPATAPNGAPVGPHDVLAASGSSGSLDGDRGAESPLVWDDDDDVRG